MSNRGNQQDDGSAIIIIVMGCFLFLFLIWGKFNEWFSFTRFNLFDYYTSAIMFITEPLGITPQNILRVKDTLTVYERGELTANDAVEMADMMSLFFITPFIAVLGWLYVLRKTQKNVFNRKFTRKQLVQDQKKLWTWLYPVADLPFDLNLEKGEWAMAKRPLDFAKKYQLLDDDLNLIEKKADVIFASQVGKLFDGFDNLEIHQKALMAIFAANTHQTKQSKAEAIKWISILNVTHKEPDYSWVEDGWKKYCDHPAIKKTFERHAYVYTVMLGMLENARGGSGTDGVFPTNYWIWLKPKERVNYLVQNCLGRKESFVECAGIINHFLAEKTLDRKILRQQTEKATQGLKEAISNIKITNSNYYDLVTY